MSSILNDTKNALGVAADSTAFDLAITMHINSAFSTLAQVGVGPEYGFVVVDDTEEWSEVIGTNNRLNSVKTYIFMKVKMLFDPPATGYLVEAMKEQIREAEWRLNQVRETTQWEPPVPRAELDTIYDGGSPSTVNPDVTFDGDSN